MPTLCRRWITKFLLSSSQKSVQTQTNLPLWQINVFPSLHFKLTLPSRSTKHRCGTSPGWENSRGLPEKLPRAATFSFAFSSFKINLINKRANEKCFVNSQMFANSSRKEKTEQHRKGSTANWEEPWRTINQPFSHWSYFSNWQSWYFSSVAMK